LVIGLFNDLELQVRDGLILLPEAQSSYFPNIPLRLLMYLANTYKGFVEEKKQKMLSILKMGSVI
jgi:hypothetical protein